MVTEADLKADDNSTDVPDRRYHSKRKKLKKKKAKKEACESILTTGMSKDIRKKGIELVCRGKSEEGFF